MKTIDPGQLKAYAFEPETLSRVTITHAQNPIQATIDPEEGSMDDTLAVTVERIGEGKDVKLNVSGPPDNEALYAAMVLAALKAQAPKKALEPQLIPSAAGAFRKATKAASKLRLALFGPAGSGKTYSALRIAKGLGQRIAVIDSENGSSEKYADRFEFDVLHLEDRSPEGYAHAMHLAAQAGYDVLIIDSISHEWEELKDYVSNLSSNPRYKGNTWSAWSEGTPKQKAFVEEIIRFPLHLIATIRSKTEWTTEQRNGKTVPVRVGLTPEQGKGIEYEFDMLMELSTDHVALVLKDRTGKYQDATVKMPDEKFGEELKAWLEG